MNLFGVEVTHLDIEAFRVLIRVLAVLVGIGTGLAFYVWRKSWIGLAGTLLLVSLAWLGANYPLQRLYGIQAPGDRLRNLAWPASVAAGHPPTSAGIVGRSSLEPFWGGLIGTLCRGRPESVYVIYPYLSLAVMLGLALVLFHHFRNREQKGPNIEALLVCYFAILAATAPLDYLGPYRVYWARMFLLKPNHALALLFIPVLIGIFAESSKTRLIAGSLVLGLLGWVFIIHWAFFCFGLGVYLVLRVFCSREHFFRDAFKVAAVVAVSAVVVAPYFNLIATHFPQAVTVERGSSKEEPTQSNWGDAMPTTSSLLFAVTLDQGLIFYLGAIGLASWLRRRGRRELLWAAQLIGAYALWIMNYFLYISARAREPDEFYYYLLFVLSVAAGHGAYQVFLWVREMTRSIASRQLRLAAVVAIVAGGFVPMTSAYWWDPATMDAHFRNSLEPLPALATELRGWVLSETNPDDVLIASGGEMQWIPALTGRQIMTPHSGWRDVARDVLIEGSSSEVPSSSKPSYVVFHPGLAAALDLERNFPIDQPHLQQVFRWRHWIVYRIGVDRDEPTSSRQ